MSKLQNYAERRDFDRSPEPRPLKRKSALPKKKQGPLRFVVQAHAARAMHYDFRLQVDDVLVSWAVPKGPSLNPKDRRLAMMTEDHPLEYAQFEGVIPKGQYGGGSVIVWDEGTWEPEGDARAALEKGKLTFTLHGKKLSGRFHLTRTRLAPKKSGESKEASGSAWLLIKGRDETAREAEVSIVQEAPESVLSGRTLDQVAQAPSSVWKSNHSKHEVSKRRARSDTSTLPKARRASFPEEQPLQLATLVARPPEGDAYLHEAKLDGYRLLAEVNSHRVQLWTRGEQHWSDRFPSVVEHLSALPLGNVWLDGEVVALDERGLSNFQLLQNTLGSAKQAQLVYVVFDLLYQDGYDLTDVPLIERKAALLDLLTRSGANPRYVRFSEHVVGNGPTFFAQACELGMEGIVSKRIDAPYRGQRTQAWLKCKCLKRQEVVIGGYTDPSGARTGLGALLVGLHDDEGKLHFAGKVGTGFSEKSLRQLHARLVKLSQKTSPFIDPPRGAAARGVHWVKPELLAEVTFSETTNGGKLRHPSFQGLREDKQAKDIQLERAATPPSSGQTTSKGIAAPPLPISITNPDRVFYPEQELTKQDVAEYYVLVADWMLPYVRDRLLTLVRCPAGHDKPCFYQKHAKQGLPKDIFSHALEQDPASEQYVYVKDAAGLVGLVQVGVLEIHTWGSRIDQLDKPDQLVFDLDPDPDLDWVRVVEGALDVKDELESLGLQSFVKTTGGKGLHVTVPLTPTTEWTEVKAFCKGVAEKLAKNQPSRYVATMTKSKRTGKIFIDYLRNAHEATAVAPYSTRARPGAPVATPISWEELASDVRGLFTLRNVPERLRSLAADPWQGFFDIQQSIPSHRRS